MPRLVGLVPGYCGPHTALASIAGIGGVPLLMQIILPTYRRLQPFQAHVFLLKSSRSVAFRLWAAAMPEQVSSATIVYGAHDPSALGFGLRSGKLPAEQHTC